VIRAASGITAAIGIEPNRRLSPSLASVAARSVAESYAGIAEVTADSWIGKVCLDDQHGSSFP
jgi:hypothetical protein